MLVCPADGPGTLADVAAGAGVIAGDRWLVLTVARPTTKERVRSTTIASAIKTTRGASVHNLSALAGAEMVVAVIVGFPFGLAGVGNPTRLLGPPR
jgi:hypothetical protein